MNAKRIKAIFPILTAGIMLFNISADAHGIDQKSEGIPASSLIQRTYQT